MLHLPVEEQAHLVPATLANFDDSASVVKSFLHEPDQRMTEGSLRYRTDADRGGRSFKDAVAQ